MGSWDLDIMAPTYLASAATGAVGQWSNTTLEMRHLSKILLFVIDLMKVITVPHTMMMTET